MSLLVSGSRDDSQSRRVSIFAYGFRPFFLVAVAAALALALALVPVLSDWSEWGIRLTAVLWSAAFAIVLFNYAPILVRPRVDGRQG